jgi:dihydropteroate synthase
MPELFHGNTGFQLPVPFQLKIGNQLIDLAAPRVMGILNLTPDSFFSGSRTQAIGNAIEKTAKMLSEGADFIDIGAISTRPGSIEITEEEEKERLRPVLTSLAREFPKALISVDTFRSGVANEALDLGASCINDISGGKFDTQMFELIGRRKVPFILMHCRGDFNSMHHGQEYINIEVEIARELQELIVKARENGIVDLIVDPGFGFSKNVAQNFELLRKLRYFEILDCPILAGLSRKSMIYKTIEKEPDQALNGTTALNMVALIQGAHILRVHDVAEAKETIQLFEKLCLQE